MPRPKGNSLNAELILDQIVDQMKTDTLSSLSMASIAQMMKIKTPSLYSHFASLDDIKSSITLRSLNLLSEELQKAMEKKNGHEKLFSFMKRYRSFAHRYPLYFDAVQTGVRSDNAILMHKADEIVRLSTEALAGWQIPSSRLIHTVRIIRSLLNGFISLEQSGGFQRSERSEKSFEELLDFTERGLKST